MFPDYDRLPEDVKVWLRKYSCDGRQMAASSSIKIIICIISKTVMEVFEPRYAFGQSGNTPICEAGKLAGLARKSNGIVSGCELTTKVARGRPATKQWMELTRKMMEDVAERSLEEAHVNLVHALVHKVIANLGRTINIEWPKGFEASLTKIFTSCVELSRLLRRQSADFFAEMLPAVYEIRHTSFDPDTMEDIDNSQAEASQDSLVGLSMFPLIYKKGDEHGENVSRRTSPYAFRPLIFIYSVTSRP